MLTSAVALLILQCLLCCTYYSTLMNSNVTPPLPLNPVFKAKDASGRLETSKHLLCLHCKYLVSLFVHSTFYPKVSYQDKPLSRLLETGATGYHVHAFSHIPTAADYLRRCSLSQALNQQNKHAIKL